MVVDIERNSTIKASHRKIQLIEFNDFSSLCYLSMFPEKKIKMKNA